MPFVLLALAAFVLMGGSGSSSAPAPAPTPAPQPAPKAPTAGDVVLDVVAAGIEAYRRYLEGK